MIVAVTGHRPGKLWGYDYNHPKYKELGNVLGSHLLELECDYAISGMALGVDTIFALVVLQLDIKLECAIPCFDHEKRWYNESIKLYHHILNKAHIITQVTKSYFTPRCMQARNEYMVDECDVLIAVWDGVEQGGTWNCVRYAKTKGKRIIFINPNNMKGGV